MNFASSDGTGLAMQMKPMLPQDQISLISNASSLLKPVNVLYRTVACWALL